MATRKLSDLSHDSMFVCKRVMVIPDRRRCINYHIHWSCDHIEALDDEESERTTDCTTYLGTKFDANPTASFTCGLRLKYKELKSDDVCPACAARYLDLTERARGRIEAKREGLLVDDVDESQQDYDAW